VNNLRRNTIVPPYFVFIFFLASCLLLAGCGYRVRGAGAPIGVSYDTIAIPIFPSTSTFLGYEAEFTRVLREQFITNSRVKIVSNEEAEVILSGTISSISTEPLTYTTTRETIHGITSTYAVTRSREMRVRVEAKLVDRQKGEIVWQDSNLTDTADFLVSEDPLSTRYNQRQAFIAVAQDLATRIYSRTMERF
jgi:outer membrane lipopolysaccharide assembly protein LptE/RlpB